MEISFKSKEHPEAKTVNVEIPETLSELVAKYGEETVADAAVNTFVIALQAILRRNIEQPQDFLDNLANTWAPGTRTAGAKKSAFEKAAGAVAKLSDADRQALLEQLRASM